MKTVLICGTDPRGPRHIDYDSGFRYGELSQLVALTPCRYAYAGFFCNCSGTL